MLKSRHMETCFTWNKIKGAILNEFNVPRETFDKFCVYQQLLLKWQKQINLVSNSSVDQFWERHLLDSLQILPFVKSVDVLDVGSGGGFPGAVIAMASSKNVTCVDSDFRKCCFLKELFRKTDTVCEVINDRMENLFNKNRKFNSITARGFSNLSQLLNVTQRYGANGIFLKGKTVFKEIEESKKNFDYDYELINSKTSKDGYILLVSNVNGNDCSDN